MILYPENLTESTKSSYNWNKEFKKMTKQKIIIIICPYILVIINNHEKIEIYSKKIQES